MINSLVALWPLVPFDVINFVKTFQQYSFLMTVFFFSERNDLTCWILFNFLFESYNPAKGV